MPSGWCRCSPRCSAGARPTRILVGVGPGSFTGIRVAVAAAHGLAIGWDAELAGLSSLALLAARRRARRGPVAVAMIGGHGELFVQQFDGAALEPLAEVHSLVPDEPRGRSPPDASSDRARRRWSRRAALARRSTPGPRARRCLAPARSASRTLAPKPVYVRAPDAKAKAAA